MIALFISAILMIRFDWSTGKELLLKIQLCVITGDLLSVSVIKSRLNVLALKNPYHAPLVLLSGSNSSVTNSTQRMVARKKYTYTYESYEDANFGCVGRLACVTEFIHLIYVFIKIILCWYLQCLWGQWDKAKQVECPSSTEVLAVGSQQDTWQRKATSWHWGAWRHRSTSSLKWLYPRTWRGCRNTTITYWRWRLKNLSWHMIACSHPHTLTSCPQMDNR